MNGAHSGDEAAGDAAEVLEEEIDACPEMDHRVFNDPLDDAIDLAFEKLWRSPASGKGMEEGTRVARDNPDKYIQNYFKQVGELTREAVFTGHHLRGLQRYRDDILRGDRMGRIREVESQITNTQEEQERLDEHISKLMRIVRSPRPPDVSTEGSCCASTERGSAKENVCCTSSTRPLPACNMDCVLQ